MPRRIWFLRPATADDLALKAALGWDDAALSTYFAGASTQRAGQVIEVAGVGIGELLVDERPGELILVRLAILPNWQGRGIGSEIVRQLVEPACELRSALTLQVHKGNPRAARLYEPLGFRPIDESDRTRRCDWIRRSRLSSCSTSPQAVSSSRRGSRRTRRR